MSTGVEVLILSNMMLTYVSGMVQIIEVMLVSLITSLLSFGLPMMTSCKPCPDPVKYPDVTCPRPTGNYGNYVNVRSVVFLLSPTIVQSIFLLDGISLSKRISHTLIH